MIGLNKDCFSNNAESEFAVGDCLSGMNSQVNYAPPPSAPHAVRNKGRKMFTTMQPAPQRLIDETGRKDHSNENSQSPVDAFS